VSNPFKTEMENSSVVTPATILGAVLIADARGLGVYHYRLRCSGAFSGRSIIRGGWARFLFPRRSDP
jgi:hypothetical protein